MSDAIDILNDQTYNESLNNESRPMFIDFYADWCGPCKIIARAMNDLAPEMTNVRFVKINVDESPNLAKQFKIKSIPTMFVLKNGQVVATKTGAMDKAKLISFINASI